jgi:biotin carboxyl carrier protein
MSKVIQEVSALLEQFCHSAWRDMHVRTARYTLFIAKPGGSANPMWRAPALVAPASVVLANDARSIVAPHIGTVAWTETVGGEVAAGAIVARIEVLGTLFDITSEFAGRVHAVEVPIGALVEFGATIASIVATAA